MSKAHHGSCLATDEVTHKRNGSYSQAKRKLLTSVSEVTCTRDQSGSPIRFNHFDRCPVIPFLLPQGRDGVGPPSPPMGGDALRAERGPQFDQVYF